MVGASRTKLPPVGIDAPDGIQWIWIGSHADYDKFIA